MVTKHQTPVKQNGPMTSIDNTVHIFPVAIYCGVPLLLFFSPVKRRIPSGTVTTASDDGSYLVSAMSDPPRGEKEATGGSVVSEAAARRAERRARIAAKGLGTSYDSPRPKKTPRPGKVRLRRRSL
jgi:hypothetical protein